MRCHLDGALLDEDVGHRLDGGGAPVHREQFRRQGVGLLPRQAGQPLFHLDQLVRPGDGAVRLAVMLADRRHIGAEVGFAAQREHRGQHAGPRRRFGVGSGHWRAGGGSAHARHHVDHPPWTGVHPGALRQFLQHGAEGGVVEHPAVHQPRRLAVGVHDVEPVEGGGFLQWLERHGEPRRRAGGQHQRIAAVDGWLELVDRPGREGAHRVASHVLPPCPSAEPVDPPVVGGPECDAAGVGHGPAGALEGGRCDQQRDVGATRLGGADAVHHGGQRIPEELPVENGIHRIPGIPSAELSGLQPGLRPPHAEQQRQVASPGDGGGEHRAVEPALRCCRRRGQPPPRDRPPRGSSPRAPCRQPAWCAACRSRGSRRPSTRPGSRRRS